MRFSLLKTNQAMCDDGGAPRILVSANDEENLV